MVTSNYGTNVPAPKLTGGAANPSYLAYLNTLTVQPFLEAALGGAKSAYCTGSVKGLVPGTTSCTAAFVANNTANGTMGVSDPFDAWAGISNAGFFTFGRSFTSDPINSPYGANGQSPSLATTVSNGYGNYNAGFLQLTVSNWHGLTMKTNFTMSKALGTGNVVQASSSFSTVDPFDIRNDYGLQSYDEKFNVNVFLNYPPPFFESQKGILGRVLGGWSISPLFVYGSGFPGEVNTGNFH